MIFKMIIFFFNFNHYFRFVTTFTVKDAIFQVSTIINVIFIKINASKLERFNDNEIEDEHDRFSFIISYIQLMDTSARLNMKKIDIQKRFYRSRFSHDRQVIEIIFLTGKWIFKLRPSTFHYNIWYEINFSFVYSMFLNMG